MKTNQKHDKSIFEKMRFSTPYSRRIQSPYAKIKSLVENEKNICLEEIFNIRFLMLKLFIFIVKSMKIMENTCKYMKHHLQFSSTFWGFHYFNIFPAEYTRL